MSETLAKAFVYALTSYAGLGLAFGVIFAAYGVQRIDDEAQGSGVGFRLLIVPGISAFWPMFAYRWARGITEPPVERNPHRLIR